MLFVYVAWMLFGDVHLVVLSRKPVCPGSPVHIVTPYCVVFHDKEALSTFACVRLRITVHMG